MIRGINYVLVADNARINRGVDPAGVYVAESGPGAKKRGIEFAANGQPRCLGADICGRKKIVGSELSLYVEIPLLIVWSPSELVHREPDRNREQELVGGASLIGGRGDIRKWINPAGIWIGEAARLVHVDLE